MTTTIERLKAIDERISGTLRRHRRLAKWTRLSSSGLMSLAIFCSAGAVIAGFFFSSGKVAGGFAIMPPLFALLAVNLRLDPKANWHSRKEGALDALRMRLRYQLPSSPTDDQVALISKEFGELNEKFEKEYVKSCSFNWNFLAGHGKSSS